jgi:toxin ParE1/3/4
VRVVFAATARNDLRRIARHLIEDNPRAAHAIVGELEARAFEIAEFPERFVRLQTYPGMQMRRRVVGRYLIFYKTGIDRVEIVHFLHGARDTARAFSGKKS